MCLVRVSVGVLVSAGVFQLGFSVGAYSVGVFLLALFCWRLSACIVLLFVFALLACFNRFLFMLSCFY